MKNTVYVIGHKKPDTDSVASAIAYAYLKNQIDPENRYIPALAGELNAETTYILDKFDIDKPILLNDVRTQVLDSMTTDFPVLKPSDPIKKAGLILGKKNVSSVPVVGKDMQYKGLVSTHTLTNFLLEQMRFEISDGMKIDLPNIVHIVKGATICASDLEAQISGKVFIAAMDPHDFRKVVPKGSIVITGHRPEALLELIEMKVGLIIVAGAEIPSDIICDAAEKNRVTLISSPYHTYQIVRMLLVGIPVGSHMDVVKPLHYDQSLNYVADQIINSHTTLPVVNDDNVVVGMISELNLAKAKGKKVILVDHNEMAQAITGIEEAEVLEIIDHHAKADVTTKRPILVRQEPVGSTGAILNKVFREQEIGMPREIAILLLSTIISDTLYLKSSTATKYDEIALKQLNQTAGLDLDAYAREIFEAKSQVADKEATEILNNDRKEFKVGEVKFAISQVETVNPKVLLDRKAELLDCLEENAKENGLKAAFLMLTDIFSEGSHILATAKDKNIYDSFDIKNNYVYMKDVMSRKSDFLPMVYEIM